MTTESVQLKYKYIDDSYTHGAYPTILINHNHLLVVDDMWIGEDKIVKYRSYNIDLNSPRIEKSFEVEDSDSRHVFMSLFENKVLSFNKNYHERINNLKTVFCYDFNTMKSHKFDLSLPESISALQDPVVVCIYY
jgi:hypothetical protein